MSIYSVSCGLKTNKPSSVAWWPLSQLTRCGLKTNKPSSVPWQPLSQLTHCGRKRNKPSSVTWRPLSQLTRSNKLSQKAQNSTSFLQALISSYEILQQHWENNLPRKQQQLRNSSTTRPPTPDVHEEERREFKIYDTTVAETSLKIASSSFSIYSVIMSVCLTFES